MFNSALDEVATSLIPFMHSRLSDIYYHLDATKVWAITFQLNIFPLKKL